MLCVCVYICVCVCVCVFKFANIFDPELSIKSL